MAGNKQRFTYEINADIGQAKKAINDLQQSIEKLSKAQINTNYLDKGINNAVAAAKELEHHLNAALNQNTGKLNLNAFTSSLEQSNISAKDLMQTLLQGGSAGQQTFASLANAIAQSEVPLRRANKTLQDFATTLKNTVKWEISSTMVHGLESALSGAVSYAKNLNTSLTNIRIVTGQSVDDMARFAKEANVAAKALSTTTKSYADASLIYYQQGDSQELAAKKAAITIKAANSSFETSAKEMSEYLTSVWNSYQVGADELERYVDIMANLGAKTATSLEEIATSMQKVAATANTVGVSMEQVSSIIATVSSVTRESAESIGTSYKTIFARIGDLKLGGVDEDGVGLGQVSSQLDAIGVKILDESGNLREMGDIIIDLGTKWQTMNQAQKTAVAQVVAGKRQYTQLMALFENWDMFQNNMNIAENSEGALQDMADIYAESWEAASARVQASMEAIYGQVLNDEFIIKLTDGFASITDGISKMISGFGGLSGVLLHTGAIGTKVFQKQIASSIDQAKDSVTTFFSQFKNNSAKDAISKLFHGDIKSVEAIKFTENTNKWKQDLEMASRQAKISGESDIKVRENAEVILTLKQSLLDAENQLSAAQMQRAQQELAYLSQEQDGLVQILRQKEERAKVEKQYAAQARVAISRANPDISADQYEGLTTQSDKAFGDINKKYEQVGVISNALDGLKSGVYDVDKAFELLNQEIQDPENKAKLQQMRQEIDALDDSEKITELEEKLKKLSRTLQQSAAQDLKEFKKALEQAFEGNQDILDKIDRIFDQTVENAREKGEDAGEAYARGLKVGALRSDFEQLITEKLDPKKLESFGGKVSQVANAALDLSSFVYAAGNAVSVLGDESSTAGEKMSALIGIISGVGEAVTGLGALATVFGPWGAIIGAAVTAAAAFFTIKDEIEKNQREQYEKEFEVTSSRSSDRVSKVAEEEKELQTLLSTYNDLYQRYQAGEDVQNELSASASTLADAYGITGAAVAAVTGNFEEFNNQIATSLDLSNQLKDAKIATNLARNTVNEHQIKDSPTVSFKTELEDQQVSQALSTSSLMSEIIENSGNYTIADLLTDVTINKDNDGNLSFTGNDLFNALYQARNADMNLPGQDMLRSLIESTIIDALNNGGTVVDDKGLVRSQQKVVNPWSLGAARYETEYLDIDKTNLEDVIQLAIDNIGLFGGVEANSLLTGAYLSKDNTKLQSVLETIIGEDSIDYTTQVQDLIGDKYSQLFDQKTGKILWDDNATADIKVEKFDLYGQWKQDIVDKISSLEENNPVRDLGESLISEIDKIVNDPTLGKAVEEYKQARKSEEILKQAEGLIKETVGKNIDNYNLEDYTLLWEKLQTSVDENKDTYNLTQYEPNSEEYIAARNKVVASIINDYTVLDDWTNIYLSLAETFTEGSDEFKAALEYTKNLKPEEVTGDLLKALSIDINKTGKAGDYTDAVKIAQQANKEKISMQQYATKTSQVASTYKSGMDLEDASAIYETFFGEGKQELEGYTKGWEEFLKLDADARKTYLEGMSKAALNAAKEKANNSLTEANNAQTVFDNDYGALIKDEQAAIAKEFAIDKDGQLKYIGQDSSKEAEARTILAQKTEQYEYDTDIEFVQQYANIVAESERIKQNIIAATNELKGYELLDDVGDTAVDRISRLGNMVSKLPEDAEEFNKLIGQLKNVKPIDLINMSELDRAETVLQTLASEKPLEENFKLDNGEIDYGEYYKALQAWREANQQAVDVIMNGADEAFTQIENRMNAARTEAEKTKTIAESLSSAIETGELTETQKLGMSQTLVDDWDKASNATERAAIAAQQWANYGTEITNAGKEVADAYIAAGIALDNTIKAAKANNVTDLLTFDFSNKETGKTDFGKFIQNVVTDPSLQAIWNKGFEDLISHTDISNMSDLGILEAVKAEIQKTGEVSQTEFDQILAGVKDSIISMYSTLGEQEASLAQQVVEEWESAFKQIASLRRSIIMGEDIGSDLTASLQDYVKYANAYTGQGSLAEAYKSGNLTANQMSLGSSEGLTEKLLASMGLAHDKWEVYEGDDGFLYQKQTKDYYDLFDSKNGETVLKGIDALAAQFNISKTDKDEATYEKAVREAVAPFIRNLLSQSDLDATTVDAKVNEFLNGSITAEETINQAANKMLGLAGEYATLLESNQQLAEADAQFKATQEEQTKIQTEAQNYANVTESIMELKPEDRNVGKIAEVLSNAGISSADYISSMQQKGFNVNSIDDITNLSYEQLEQYENLMQQDAAEAGKTIVEAATLFKNIVTGEEGSIVGTNGETGLGFGKDSTAGKTAEEYLKEATNNYNSSLDAYNADTSIDLSSQIDDALTSAKTQFESVDQLYDLKQGTNEWYQGLDEVSSAYQGVGEAQEIINKLYDGTISLKDANEQLCSITMKTGDKIEDMTDAQYDQWKQMLRNNKVNIKGYKTLEDYFKECDKGRAITQKMTKSTKKFVDEMDDAGSEANKMIKELENFEDLDLDGIMDPEETGWDELMDAIVPEEFQGITDQLLSVWTQFGGDWNAALAAGFDTATNTFNAETQQLLTAMGLSQEQILSMQDQIKIAIQNGASMGEIDFLSMIAGMDVNNIPFDSMIDKLNAAMQQIHAAAAAMGVPLTPPWQNIPTLASKGVGAHGGGGGGNNASTKPSGSSGSGGGSNNKTVKDQVRAEDEIERYHKQNDTLERVASTLEKIDKLKDRSYGADHIAQLEAETAALNDQLEAQQDLHDEALKWMASDKSELELLGATFDENGTITNYEDVMTRIINTYNAAIDKYNASDQDDGDEAALEAAEQAFEDAKQAIEDYEEALSTANDSANEMLEIQNKLSELEVEKITYKLELKLDINESELDTIDYYKNKYEDALEDQDEYFEKLIEANSVYESNLTALEDARSELEAKYAMGLINDADYAAQMEELQQQMLENLNDLEDLKDEINEAYGNTLEMAREEIDEITDLIDGNVSTLESYINILELSGRGNDYETLKQMYSALYENNLAKVQIHKDALDALLAEEQALLNKYKDGNQEMSEADKDRHRVLQQQIQETRDVLNEATEQTLESLRSGFEIMIQSIGYQLDQFMSGTAASLNHLQEQYDYYTESQGRYVSTSKELYEVSKLNRDIENTLAATTNAASKEALKALQEKINKQSELNELTEYDIEMNQLQYQLLLARIKLEEAQSSKDTVRLTRDEDGNYAYQYTANQDKIDEAAQHYEDVLQQINDTTVQRTQEIEAQIVSTMQNYKEKLLEISLDYSLTEEERLQRIEELNAQFAETMQYLQEQNNIAVSNLTNNQSAIAEHYGVNVSEITASTAGNVNASVQSMIQNAQSYIDAMHDAVYGEEGILTLWEQYQLAMENVNEESGTSFEQLREDVTLMTESLEGFKTEAAEVITTLTDTLDSINDLTEAWDQHGAELSDIITRYENIVEIIQRTRNAMSGFGGSGSSSNGGNGESGKAYATGGLADYTGLAWLDGTPDKPELVLNPTDTENLITAVDTVRSLDSGILGGLVNSIKNSAAAMMNMFNSAYHVAGTVFTKNADTAELTQDIHITAEFPNVTEKNEIEEALLSLANRATQFANRRK